jgi:DNA polymerase V
MLEAVRDLSPRVEYYSIDEFFFDGSVAPAGDFGAFATAVRDAILGRVRVPVTVEIARTRTLAKLISDAVKPFGALAILDRAAEESLLAAHPVTDVTGIAGRREKRLMPWGIRTCLDLAQADRRLVRQLLTASGEALWWELNGDPVIPIRTERMPHRVLSRGGSFGEPTDRPVVLWAWLVRNLERLVEELRYHRVVTGRVAV